MKKNTKQEQTTKERFVSNTKNLVFFVLICAFFLLAVNLFYISLSSQKIIYRAESGWQDYRKTLPDNILQYAFFGDSHAQVGINPFYINDSYNFAISGEKYIETYFKLKKLLGTDNVTLKFVILEIDQQTFSDKASLSETLFRDTAFYHAFVSFDEMSKLKKVSLISIYLDAYLPVVGKGQEIISTFLQSQLTQMYLGWTNTTGNYSTLDKSRLAAITYASQFSKKPTFLETTRLIYFKKVLQLAKANNLTIVFIKYPLTNEYSLELAAHNISRQDYYDNLFKEINNETSKYYVLDYHDLFLNQSDLFADPDHCNYFGSKILSEKVNDDLTKIRDGNFSFSNTSI